jgi:hypothetical protein
MFLIVFNVTGSNADLKKYVHFFVKLDISIRRAGGH